MLAKIDKDEAVNLGTFVKIALYFDYGIDEKF